MAKVYTKIGTGVGSYVIHANFSVSPDPYPSGATVTQTSQPTLSNVVNSSTVTVKASETNCQSGYTYPVNVYKSSDGSNWTYVDYLQSGSVSINVGTGTIYVKVGPATVGTTYRYRVKVYGRQSSAGGTDQIKYYPSSSTWYTSTSASPSFSLSSVSLTTPSAYALSGYAYGASPSTGETVYTSSMKMSASASGTVNNIHALWKRVYYYYRVRYYKNDGSGDSSYYPSSTTGIQSTTPSPSFSLSNIPAPTRYGYKFKGWAYGATTSSGETAYTSKMTLSASATTSSGATVNNIHAVWEQLRSYRVRIYGNGGKSGSLDVAYYPKEAMTYTEESSVRINIPDLPGFTRSGYRLVGFADGATETAGETVYKSYRTVYPAFGGITKEMHAVWERVYYFYRIKYYLNDGSGNFGYRPSVGYYQDTSTTPTFYFSNLPTPTRTGYTFRGWAKGATEVAGESVYTQYITVSANDDATNPLVNAVHAVWDQQYSYRVHAYGNGGQSVHGNNDEYSPSNTEWYYTSTASPSFDLNRLPVFSRTGYNFLGWSYTSSGGTVYTDSVQLTAEKGGKVNNLYAVWQEKYKYRVHIYGNGGTTSGGATTVYTPSSTGWYISNTSSVKLVVSNVGEFKNGHKHFVGWAYGASPSAGETVYTSTIQLTATEDGSTNNVHIVWEDAIQPFYWLGTDAADNASIARGKTRNMTASMWSAFANRVEELGDACGASVSVSRVSVSGKMMASQYNSAVSALATIRLVLGATSVSLPSTVTANVTPITAAQFNGINSIKGCLNRLIEVYNG